jgi:GTP pyrophosphokinase
MEQVQTLRVALLETCQTYLDDETCQRIIRACDYAETAHAGQFRKSGEPYITHPLQVAHYVAQLYIDESVIIAALLHDVAEDTDCTLDDIEAEFGLQVRLLVDGVTHLKDVSQLEDLAHLLLATSNDVRVVLIKLYDRLHNLRTLKFMSPEQKRRKAFESQRIYVPLAAKLGMWELKNELETLILEHIDPIAYEHIQAGLATAKEQLSPTLEAFMEEVQQSLREHHLPATLKIAHRSPYRLYEIAGRARLDAESFQRAFKVILLVDSVPSCYLALGYLHHFYPHVAQGLSDSIGNPRDTFYRSLHTALIVPGLRMPLPIRIRTYEFERMSQIGILTHIQFATADQEKQPADAPWLTKLGELFSESENASKFVDSVFRDILQKHVDCFTPRGKRVSLPRGATVLDFAYYVHTDIGHECRGALVNGQPVDLSYQLSDGDQVEIIRTRHPNPAYEWLDTSLGYATTARALRKIREWFRRQETEVIIQRGRALLREERQRFNATDVLAQTLADDFQLEDKQALYYALGSGALTLSDLARTILNRVPSVFAQSARPIASVQDSQGQQGWLTRLGEQKIRLARCCQPRIGDVVVTRADWESRPLLFVHRADCRCILTSSKHESMIRLEWLQSNQPLQVAHLRVQGYDRGGLLRDVSLLITRAGANIMQVESVLADKMITMRLRLEVPDQETFITIVHRLATLQNITRVQCMSAQEIQTWQASTHQAAAD